MITYQWRGPVRNDELNALHAECFGHLLTADDWQAQLTRHSLGWVCARQHAGSAEGTMSADNGRPSWEARLVGFVNVAWDGGGHAFILDTIVTASLRRRGVGTGLVALAAQEARAAGCDWLHVDFEDHLRPFYFDSCGFVPTDAGLIALRNRTPTRNSSTDEFIG